MSSQLSLYELCKSFYDYEKFLKKSDKIKSLCVI